LLCECVTDPSARSDTGLPLHTRIMHSIYQRFNVGSALLSSCLFTLLGCIALTTYFHEASPQGTLAVDSLKVKVATPKYSRESQQIAHISFDYDADLTPLFHWNTKQVFLYLSGEYTNKQGTQNEVVFWDKIVRRKRDAQIHIRGKNKYVFKDINKSFHNASALTYTMRYNVMPWVGPLRYGVAAQLGPEKWPQAETKV